MYGDVEPTYETMRRRYLCRGHSFVFESLSRRYGTRPTRFPPERGFNQGSQAPRVLRQQLQAASHFPTFGLVERTLLEQAQQQGRPVGRDTRTASFAMPE